MTFSVFAFSLRTLSALVLSGVTAGASAQSLALDDATRYALLGPSFSYHQQRTHSGRAYNEQHLGIGLERRNKISSDSDWAQSTAVLLMKDSFSKPMLSGALSLEYRLLDLAGHRLSTGVQVGLAYKHKSWEQNADWVPFAGPQVSIRPHSSGPGLSVVYYYKRNATTGKVNGLVHAQTSWTF